jgi:RNA polymerase sigma-70 factor (ECF subfamily)
MHAEKELERLYDEHSQALFAYLLNFTRNPDDTRDLLQELFVKLARNRDLLAGVRDTKAFLIRLAHNQAVDLMRRRGTRERNHEELATESVSLFAPQSDPDEKAFNEALSRALAALPQEQRVVVHLKLWEGMTFEAIAATLGLSANTAASRHRYGIDKLRELLRPLYEEIE